MIGSLNLQRYKYGIWFGVCILSRMLTAIYYIEDIDSLRFALAAHEYDVVALRPHFPGYAAYCFVLRGLFEVTGNVGVSFAILGGSAMFLILYFSEKLWQLYVSRPTNLLPGLLFVCPLFWLMSNRYMPDIMGLALLMGGTYCMVRAWRTPTERRVALLGFGFLLGLEAGVRLSYLPFFLPAAILAVKFPRELPRMVLAGLVGTLIWLIPLLLLTGSEELLRVAQRHTAGHFNEWGGGVTSDDAGYGVRLIAMLESIWADGLGGWWPERNGVTLLVSGGWLAGFAVGIRVFLRGKWARRSGVPLVLVSVLAYTLWAYFFQNIVYKPRHILPLLPFLILLATAGWTKILAFRTRGRQIAAGISLAALLLVTGVLVRQHTQPSAISQMKTWLKPRANPETAILSNRLINHYLWRHRGFQSWFFDYHVDYSGLRDWYTTGRKVYSTRRIDDFLAAQPDTVHFFAHNPYVNRLWSTVTLYEYQRDETE
ncbi:MAG: hypothetical protein AAF998_00045 [Bacteroidota bacterium]